MTVDFVKRRYAGLYAYTSQLPYRHIYQLALIRVFYKLPLNCHPDRWAKGCLFEVSSFGFLSMARNRCEFPIQKRILWKAVDLLYGYIRWFFSWRGNSFWTEQDLAAIGKYEASCKCNFSFTNILSLKYDFFVKFASLGMH